MALARHYCGKVMSPMIVVLSHFKICLTKLLLFLLFCDLMELKRFTTQFLPLKIYCLDFNHVMQYCMTVCTRQYIIFVQEYIEDNF